MEVDTEGEGAPPVEVEGEAIVDVIVVEIVEGVIEENKNGDIVMEEEASVVIVAVVEEVEEVEEKMNEERLVEEEAVPVPDNPEAETEAAPTFYWEPKDIEWTEVDLETKVGLSFFSPFPQDLIPSFLPFFSDRSDLQRL